MACKNFPPAHPRTMKGDFRMSEKLRADIGQSQEPPPDDRGRSTEEDDLMTFDEYLDAFDRDTESMYS